MTHEMVERLARVLSPQSWQALGTACDTKAKKKRREASLDYARRCILAMREPTKDMNDAGGSVDDAEEFYVGETTALAVYQAMIDQVLK